MWRVASAVPCLPVPVRDTPFSGQVHGSAGSLGTLGLDSQKLGSLLTIILNARGSTESAAFSEYLIAKADLAITVPDNLTFEEAATLGVGLSTVVSCALVELLVILHFQSSQY